MNLGNLFDPVSAFIVVGGTIAATVLRCGFADSRIALVALVRQLHGRFRPANAQAELAIHVREMRQDGVIRGQSHHVGDAAFDEATDALIRSRSMEGLQSAYLDHKRLRTEQNMRAVRTFAQAADLSPVFGLAGTLVSLSQMPGGAGASGDFTRAISMAVLTTLYGLLLGNLIFAPLGRMVARRAAQEERDRENVLDWLEDQLAEALPGGSKCP